MITTGAISESERTVYWVHPSGELMLAPDTRMRPFRGWRRVECTTVAETEQFSRRMARQQYEKMKSTAVEDHLRSRSDIERIKANCRLRLAKGCISPEDERLTRKTLRDMERRESMFLEMLFTEPSLTRSHLAIEATESKIGNAAYQGKHKGLYDHEINPVSKLAEASV